MKPANLFRAEIKVIAPPDILDSLAVRIPGETEDEFNRRNEIFHAVIEIGNQLNKTRKAYK